MAVVDVEELAKKQGLTKLAGRELEEVLGGAKDPNWKPEKVAEEVTEVAGNEFGKTRKFNIKKQESKTWNELDNVKGRDRKCSGEGKNKKYYEWDYTHNDIEVYNHNGTHLGSMNPITGDMYKPAVSGRTISI